MPQHSTPIQSGESTSSVQRNATAMAGKNAEVDYSSSTTESDQLVYSPQADSAQLPYSPQADSAQLPYSPQADSAQLPYSPQADSAQLPYSPQATDPQLAYSPRTIGVTQLVSESQAIRRKQLL